MPQSGQGCSAAPATLSVLLFQMNGFGQICPLRNRPTVCPSDNSASLLSYQSLPTSSEVWRGHGQEAKIGSAGGHRIASNVKRLSRFSSRVSPRGVPARGGVPDRCHASGAAVDICSDAPAWAQRAERAADGGVVYVSRALSVSPRAPRINAQRVARCDPYNIRNCLPPKKLRREIQ